jgi:hypothetical protein
MSFFQLVRREMQGSSTGWSSCPASGCQQCYNSGRDQCRAQAAGGGELGVWSAALFVIALLLFIKTQHYI